ncbi:MAG: spondin domain-containing protein [Gammaproteobacteria bacterium]|nr:spondin domain-containing protein [Gammaproteobacteria bacterium]
MRIPFTLAVVAATVLLLQGCFHNDDDDNITPPPTPVDTRQFQIDVTNLTQNQPITPVALVLHRAGYQAFMLGEQSSVALEVLAEAGDTSAFLSEAGASTAVLDTAAGAAMIAAGASERFMLTGSGDEYKLTLVGMLANTNDGITALNSINIGDIENGASTVFLANVYDSGTEANNEVASDIPGQGGEGFNATRNDRDFIIVHPGVISMMDGLATSDLNQSYRFDNPAMKVKVTRIQ